MLYLRNELFVEFIQVLKTYERFVFCSRKKCNGVFLANSLSTGFLPAVIISDWLWKDHRPTAMFGFMASFAPRLLFFVEITPISSRKQVMSSPNRV